MPAARPVGSSAWHGMGLMVPLSIVHSNALKNILGGINEFDGPDHLYFHEGGKGRHEHSDSRLFNYAKLRFLSRNLRVDVDEYQFDRFRFDGVTSIMYTHHGIGAEFSGGCHEYFANYADLEAIVYLMLPNDAV
ncbi:starch branching enzyme IIb [Armillaria nabsnona]|nr:starch branching enzyme IIb [Armillaria nabsnona]